MKFSDFWDRLMQVMLVGMAFLISIGALMRYVFNHPLHFVDEVAGIILLAITFLGLAFVEKANRHVNIDSVLNLFPRKGKAVLSRINWVIEIIWVVVVLVFTTMTTIDYFNTQKRSISTDWLLYPFAAIMILGTAMLLVEYLVQGKSPFSFLRRKTKEQHDDCREANSK